MRKVISISLLAGLLGFAALAYADDDARGTYKTSHSVDDGKVYYTMTLEKNGQARFKLEATDGVDRDSGTQEKYGRVMRRLARKDRIVHTGTWSQRNDRVVITLTRIDGDKHNSSMFARLKDNELVFTSWDSSMYGSKMPLRFDKESGSGSSGLSTNDAIIAGAAILALGAIAANNSNNSNASSGRDETYDFQVMEPDDDPKAGIKYKLKLKGDDYAELAVDMVGTLFGGQDDNRALGTITRTLIEHDRVVLTGKYRTRGDNIMLTFTKISYGNTEKDHRSEFEGQITRRGIAMSSWDKRFFGHEANFRFNKR